MILPAAAAESHRGYSMKALLRFLFSLRTVIVVVLAVALVGGGGYLYYVETAGASAPSFRTEPVARKNLTATITATGTIEPEEVIDVGAQVAGQILKFGADPTDSTKVVDYCTPVDKDTVLAEIDPTIYLAHLKQAKAALATANATLASAKAALAKSEASRDALLDAYQRDKSSPGAIAQQQIIADKGAYDVAVADTKVQAAAIQQAESGVQQAKANLMEAQTNVDYCTIKSPVKGVIVDRRVNVGQTVVSSLSAPSLFLLAKDLTRLEVWASVNEADIGNIHIGQDVTFTVDARPGKTYHGLVQQIRYNATMTQNVVTYTVVVSTTNKVLDAPAETTVTTPSGQKGSSSSELELLPYLTANLTFHVAERKNALLAPNAALRWKPQLAQVAPEFRDEYEQSLRKRAPQTPGEEPAAPAGDKKPGKDREGGAASHGMVWVKEGEFVRPIKLVTGLTDGAMTEIVKVQQEGETLEEGTQLVTGEVQGQAGPGTTNPFAPPPIFRPKKKKEDQ
jgi:HlyD family secretion protein